jgi:hypothetical protein
VYVAISMFGLTSLTRVTMPLSVTSEPIWPAFTLRSGMAFSLVRGSTRTS